MSDLIKRLDGQISFQESIGNLTGINLLLDCKAEIERLTLANETLSALNVEYLERVKALELPKQEPVAYVSKMALEALASNTITSARVWGKENIDPSDEIPLYTSPNNHIVDLGKQVGDGVD